MIVVLYICTNKIYKNSNYIRYYITLLLIVSVLLCLYGRTTKINQSSITELDVIHISSKTVVRNIVKNASYIL